MLHFAKDMLRFGAVLGHGASELASKNMCFDTKDTSLTRFDTNTLHENNDFDF